ncbi:YlxR family protein [Leptolyngbya sp. FACHB-711]|uniref:YlxR family protein n=1 Tax=unclassified Leptolyngbya TaxID=2650499 RepID=UPI001681EB00|nr:YlxR family protein [Leptolyngbya sp. FACHB-711]MBD1850664.1 YlxR family protein [Cyanobacteria bacterium FACHB-502]MBD2025566.1 YlxR family protein [Leptolyngbya sp. FACHB-711]
MPPNHRRCISCRRVAPREEFWRVVRSFPSQIVMLDQGMGRSAYLCPDSACLQTAQRKDRLGRALKATVSEEIYRTLWQRLSTTATIE